MELRNFILLITLGLAALLIVLKAVMLIIPVVGTGLTAFTILAIKAYIGSKAAQKIEKHEDTIKEKVTN